jgi:hypothetical protein
MTKAQKKFWRYVLWSVLFPITVVVAPLYKWYMKVAKRKQVQVKYSEIVKGFSYLVVPDSEVEKKAKQRAEICGGCRFAKFNGKLNTIVVDDKTHQIRGMYCDMCGCSLSGLVRSDKTCPAGKWR